MTIDELIASIMAVEDDPSAPVPPKVQRIFDIADESGDYSALIGVDSVSLASKDGKIIYYTVKWAGVEEWSKNMMKNLAEATMDRVVTESTTHAPHLSS